MDRTSPTILLVEDNPAHAELVLRSFEEHKYDNKIIHLPDGEAALNYLMPAQDETPNPLPHIILLDLRLPRIDGLEVLRRLKSSLQNSCHHFDHVGSRARCSGSLFASRKQLYRQAHRLCPVCGRDGRYRAVLAGIELFPVAVIFRVILRGEGSV